MTKIRNTDGQNPLQEQYAREEVLWFFDRLAHDGKAALTTLVDGLCTLGYPEAFSQAIVADMINDGLLVLVPEGKNAFTHAMKGDNDGKYNDTPA